MSSPSLNIPPIYNGPCAEPMDCDCQLNVFDAYGSTCEVCCVFVCDHNQEEHDDICPKWHDKPEDGEAA